MRKGSEAEARGGEEEEENIKRGHYALPATLKGSALIPLGPIDIAQMTEEGKTHQLNEFK